MKIAMAMTPERAKDVCNPEFVRELEEEHTLVWGSPSLDDAELVELTRGADLVVTSWRTPPLPPDVFDDRPGTGAIAHAAGTIKRIVPRELMEKVPVFSAGAGLAASVGEYCLAVTLALSRRLPEFETSMRENRWRPHGVRGRELTGKSVGILGASRTARAFIVLLAPFGVDIIVFDPYLDEAGARNLGVRLGTLDEALQADVVSLHLPVTPETRNLIDAKRVAQIRDSAIVVNSARPDVVDSRALFARAVRNEIYLAVDVFDEEPVTLDDDIRASDRVILTPHIAGETVDAHQSLARLAIADALTYLATGTRGSSWVDPDKWEISA